MLQFTVCVLWLLLLPVGGRPASPAVADARDGPPFRTAVASWFLSWLALQNVYVFAASMDWAVGGVWELEFRMAVAVAHGALERYFWLE